MALSAEQRRVLRIAIADAEIADAIADQIDSGGNPVAENVAELGPLTGTYVIPAEPTGAEVDTSVQVVADKVDELIQAMVASGQMEAP